MPAVPRRRLAVRAHLYPLVRCLARALEEQEDSVVISSDLHAALARVALLTGTPLEQVAARALRSKFPL